MIPSKCGFDSRIRCYHHGLLNRRFPPPLLSPMTFSHDDTSDPSTATAVIKGVSKAPEGISAWRGFPPFFSYLTSSSGCVLAVLAHCSFPLLRQLAVTKGTSYVPVGILQTEVIHKVDSCGTTLSTLHRLQSNATPGLDRLSVLHWSYEFGE